MEKTKGLSSAEAQKRLAENGRNTLGTDKKASRLKMFTGQFKDVMVMILLAATAVSFVMGELSDAVTIMVIVVLNALLGFFQEYRTERTIESLKKLAAPTARVMRDGAATSVPAEEIVVGDVLLLEAGDKIAADCRITDAMALECDEATLTGESIPVTKGVAPCDEGKLNQVGMVYMGCIVTKGHGMAEVVRTGKSTQMGLVSDMLGEISEERTPLQKRLGELGKIIGAACIVICILVSAVGIFRGYAVFDMLFTGISLAVAAIPEGLPATVTISLALAVRRIYKQKALVHRLHSVETLGCTSVICTDKTGTLTMNKMTVTETYTAGFYSGEKSKDGSGAGNGERGLSASKGDIRGAVSADKNADLRMLLTCGVLCCNAVISADGAESGDPTELALLNYARKNHVTVGGYTRINENPFDSEKRSMTVTVKSAKGEICDFTKGAADVIIPAVTHILTNGSVRAITESDRRRANAACADMAEKGLRVLAFSYKRNGQNVFIGLQGMSDPLRPEIRGAVKKCKKAGIRIVMLTGDHKSTAAEIARQACILQGDVMTGAELARLTDEQLDRRLDTLSVVARVSPSDKLRIVRAFKRRGEIVAMTGDGVNDAPAVKEASIGVAMGIQGTDVTKDAAELVLLDDNFATLVSAVSQGRTIYSNIRKFIRYMLSCNIGEVLTMLIGMLMGLPVILVPIQLLLVNLVTDSLPAIALGMEPEDDSVMTRPPRKANESIFSGGLVGKILVRGIVIGACTIAAFMSAYSGEESLTAARTAALAALSVSQLVFVFECKDERRSIFTAQYAKNPFLLFAVAASLSVVLAAVYIPIAGGVFGTVPLDASIVAVVAALVTVPAVVTGIAKLLGSTKRG